MDWQAVSSDIDWQRHGKLGEDDMAIQRIPLLMARE
jgi:hypothetical protein